MSTQIQPSPDLSSTLAHKADAQESVTSTHLLEFLSCPSCVGKLEQRGTELHCNACGDTYLIVNGIPRFVSPENYASTFGLQWNIYVKTQLDSHTGVPLSRERVFAATGWPEQMIGQTILECGSGAGRFTEVLVSTGANVLSFDLSSAVEANMKNNGHNDNLMIFQSRIESAPIKEGTIDKVFCLGVIQHTPDPAASFRAMAKYVRPGGSLVIDCYPKTVRGMLTWKYILRPLTKRMNSETTYRIVRWYVPKLVPVSIGLTKVFGRWSKRLLPVQQYEDIFPLTKEQNVEWAVLDTFDALTPAHDHPQTLATVRKWYEDAGFENLNIFFGWNGVVARGTKRL